MSASGSDSLLIAFAAATVLVLMLVPSTLALPGSTDRAGVPSRAPGELGGPSMGSAEVLRAASASLALGFGPAEGHPWSCSGAGESTWRCTTPTAAAFPAANGRPGSSSGALPSDRDYAGMIYDPGDGYVVLFGGCLSPAGTGCTSSGAVNDTWTFRNGSWSDLTPNLRVAPPAEGNSGALTYDAGDGYVLYACPNYANPNGSFETWSFHGGNWTLRSTNFSPPAGLALFSLAYDAADGYVLLFGGIYPTALWWVYPSSNFTWSYRAGNWTNRSASLSAAPLARWGASMTYDVADGYVLLFGGILNGTHCGPPQCYRNDTWSYVGGVWTNRTNGTTPPQTLFGSLTYDSGDGYVLLQGGVSPGDALGAGRIDTWTYHAGVWTNRTFGNEGPSDRVAAALADDPADGFVLLFGGDLPMYISSSPGPAIPWAYHAGSWVPLSAEASPSAAAPSMTYDAALGAVVLFGPSSLEGNQGETWTFANGTWTLLPEQNAPSSRSGPMMTYDTAAGIVLLFGGLAVGTSSWPPPGTPLSDTWSFGNGTWTAIATGPNRTPPPRSQGSLSYDPDGRQDVLFGGIGWQTQLNLSDTWTFHNGSWTPLRLNVSPPAGGGGAMAYDAADGYLLYFSGHPGAGSCSTPCGGTWTYRQGLWTNRSASVNTAPSPRTGAALTYDALGREILLFGGRTAPTTPTGSSALLNDTWTYSGGNWTLLGTSLSPPAREAAGIADDPSTGQVVLYGGFQDGNGSGLGDTWVFSAGSWSQLAPALRPSLGIVDTNLTVRFVVRSSGITPPLRYSYQGLPPGCASADLAELDCAPQRAGGYSVTVTVSDSVGIGARASAFLGVNPAPTVALASSSPAMTVGGQTTLTASVLGGTPPFTFAYAGLPPGCAGTNLSTWSCTPTQGGHYLIRVLVRDSVGGASSAQVALTVNPTGPGHSDRGPGQGPVRSSQTPGPRASALGELGSALLAAGPWFVAGVLLAVLVPAAWERRRRRAREDARELLERLRARPPADNADAMRP